MRLNIFNRLIGKFVVLVSFFASISVASYGQITMSANLQTNHLWRGGEVADGFVMTYDAAIKTLEDHLLFGVWGGTNAEGTYKEFNYYTSLSFDHLSISLWDTYNFSDYATYNNEEFFNYTASSSGRFLDATVAYRVSNNFPLKLSWSTILFGRDRWSDNSANRYSTFCHAEYQIYNQDVWRVDAGVGGAFALNPEGRDRSNFYGEDYGVVHISIVLSRDLKINDYTIPISLTTLWNPQSEQGYIQLAAEVLSF